MSQCGNLISDTHVRSLVVVEVYVPSYYIPCMFQAVEHSSRIDTFSFYYTVGPFCYGIVSRIGIFSHADTDMMST